MSTNDTRSSGTRRPSRENESGARRTGKKRMSRKARMRRRRRAIAILVFLIAILAAVAVLGLLKLNSTIGKVHKVNTTPTSVIAASEETFVQDATEPDTLSAQDVDFNADGIELMEQDGVKNILLIGQDRREAEGEDRARSDSMILCSINCNEKTITLTSFMRDMYVQIPGYSANRINSAYMFGGMELLDQTIEQNFGIHVDGNVEVDFDGFVNSLAVIGPIPLEITQEEADYLNGGAWEDQEEYGNDGTWAIQPGTADNPSWLAPQQALAYSRMRYIGNSDWDRTERQRKVIQAAFKQALQLDLPKLIAAANAIFPNLSTDMETSELLSIAKTIYVNKITTMESYRIPVDNYYSPETIEGMSVLVPDLSMNAQYIQNYIYGTPIDESQASRYNYGSDGSGDTYYDDTSYYDGSSYDGGSYDDGSYDDGSYDDSYSEETYYDDGSSDDGSSDNDSYSEETY